MWYYMKDGWFDSTKEGPIEDDEFSVLAFDGKLKRSTLVVHQIHTKGDWLKLDDVPRLVSQCEGGETYRAEMESTRLAKDQKAREAVRQERELTRIREMELAEEKKLFQAVIVQPVPAPQVIPQPQYYSVPQFRCPFCQTTLPPVTRSKVSTGGWVLFVLLIVVLCWPLCWIGLLMTEKENFCGQCGLRLG